MSDIEKADKIMKEFQTKLYKFCEEHISPTEVNTSYMVAGIMMKTAIEIYAASMSEETILTVLDEVKTTAPSIIGRLHREIDDVTVH